MKSEVEKIADSMTEDTLILLVKAYAERLDGDTGPMSEEARYLVYNAPKVRALERRGLTEFKTFDSEFGPERWRLLSELGLQVAAHVVKKYEITWGPKR